jgi:hypothetical protein
MNWYMENYRNYYDAYYRAYGWPVPPSIPNAAPGENVVTETPPAEAQAQPEQRAAAAAQNNQQLRLDAQGNAFMDADDDEDGGGREWDFLDWMYTIARMAVFLSIIYFYSNMFRFVVVVFCAFALQYLHQALRRRNPPAPRPPVVPPQAQQPEQREDNGGVGVGQRNEAVNREPPVQPVVPPNATTDVVTITDDTPRGIFAVWAFFTAFFSSLFPEIPAN